MFKRLRIAILLYVLLFVAAAQFFAAKRSTDWDAPLWVDVYLVDGDGRSSTREYLDHVSAAEFNEIEVFFNGEARRYELPIERPFRVNFSGEYPRQLPQLDPEPSAFATLWWSLRMRWLCALLQWRKTGPSGDIVAFAVFHEPAETLALDRSTALQKGLIVVAHQFADRRARGSNQMVLAHELLHTLGATDKYEPGSNAPRFPDGYAAPTAKPLLPQSKAELMAGRIPLDERRAAIPESLRQVLIGNATAAEIGWLRN
jgi:hypothetical protein